MVTCLAKNCDEGVTFDPQAAVRDGTAADEPDRSG